MVEFPNPFEEDHSAEKKLSVIVDLDLIGLGSDNHQHSKHLSFKFCSILNAMLFKSKVTIEGMYLSDIFENVSRNTIKVLITFAQIL